MATFHFGRLHLFLCVIGLALLGGGLVLFRTASTEGDRTSSTGTSAHADSKRPGEQKRATWQVGKQRAFSVNLVSQVSVDKSAILDVRIRGVWLLTNIAEDSARRPIGQLRPEIVDIRSSPEEEPALSHAVLERTSILLIPP